LSSGTHEEGSGQMSYDPRAILTVGKTDENMPKGAGDMVKDRASGYGAGAYQAQKKPVRATSKKCSKVKLMQKKKGVL